METVYEPQFIFSWWSLMSFYSSLCPDKVKQGCNQNLFWNEHLGNRHLFISYWSKRHTWHQNFSSLNSFSEGAQLAGNFAGPVNPSTPNAYVSKDAAALVSVQSSWEEVFNLITSLETEEMEQVEPLTCKVHTLSLSYRPSPGLNQLAPCSCQLSNYFLSKAVVGVEESDTWKVDLLSM